MNKQKKMWAFALSKTIIFEVEYIQLKGNKNAHFSTQASKFNQPKTDWIQCGQAQEELLFGLARTFWEKWDKKHLHDLTDDEYLELLADIEELKKEYKYLEVDQREDLSNNHISFWSLKELSMTFGKKSKN